VAQSTSAASQGIGEGRVCRSMPASSVNAAAVS
jgi:hypothetical protein